MGVIDPIHELVDTILDNREVVFFLGDGASMNGTHEDKPFSGLNQMMGTILKGSGPVPTVGKEQFAHFLSIIKKWENEKQLKERLRQVLNGEPSPAHYYLAALSIALYGESNALFYLSISYDNIMRKAFLYLERNPVRWFKPVTVPLLQNIAESKFHKILVNIKNHIENGWPVIVNIFGEMDSQSLIFKQSGMKFEQMVEEKLIEWMAKPLVFIEYSFMDKMLKELLISVRRKSPIFMVNSSMDIPPEIRDMDKAYHIRHDFPDFVYHLLAIIAEKTPLVRKKVDKILSFKNPPPVLPIPRIRKEAGVSLVSPSGRADLSLVKKILILAANPKLTPPLRLDEEVREIEEGLQRSKYRDQFEIKSKWAVRLRDIRRALLDHEPHIIHFIGHGRDNKLLVEDEMGTPVRVSSQAFADLCELCSSHVECVVLNACYSSRQADAISKHINYVIGMRKGIKDKASIEFAVGFYDALGAGKSIEEAFKFACNAIKMIPNLPGHLTPVLKKKEDSKK